MTPVQRVVDFIEKNQNLKTSELLWSLEVRRHNLPTSTVLVLIDQVRKNNC